MTMGFTPSSSKTVDVVQNELHVRNFKLQITNSPKHNTIENCRRWW